MKRTILAITLCSLAAFLTGCSASGGRPNFIQRFGASILGGIGLEPGTETYEGGTKVSERLETITLEEEYHLGRAVAAKIASRFPLTGTQEELEYLAKVGNAVAAFSSRPQLFTPYRFGIIDTPNFDAISAPGGYIFVSRGLLESLQDEDQLAAILAHEVMHVANRHALRSVDPESLDEALAAAGIVLGALTCNELLAEASIAFSASIDEIVSVLIERGYSRDLEYEADNGAAALMASAGYEVQALRETLRILESQGGGGSGGWLSTHPAPGDRLSKLDKFPARESGYRAIRGRRFAHSIEGK